MKDKLLYIPFSSQDKTINWITKCCQQLQKYNFETAEVLDLNQWQQVSPKEFWSFSWQSQSKSVSNNHQVFWEVIPLRRFKQLKAINLLLNFYLLKLKLWLKKP